jgi:hypothetical protein
MELHISEPGDASLSAMKCLMDQMNDKDQATREA